VTDPATNQTLELATTRTACYSCHPGPKTQCLRGAMGTLKDASGNNQMECQSCHGTMSTVGTPTRQGWFQEPACQMCHTGTAVTNSGQIAYTSVFSSGTTQRVAADQTFATNPNTPQAGISLYRYSSGHGGLQCEACHNSTHAEYATPITNDNVQSVNLQGHSGMLAECSACHSTVPTTVNGGPHGLHPIGSSWVSQHPNVVNSSGSTQCQVCHGTDYRGTILSKMKAARTMASRSFAAGDVIGCYSCHNGPGG
jgi:nitrate/TMAO reductase-like tetraheme cytochrome c subunit